MEKFSANILIVEDDPLVAMNYEDILNEAGCLTVIADRVSQAVNFINQRDFNLIICDHNLSDAEGIDLLEHIKNSRLYIPVIYLSANIPELIDKLKQYEFVKEILCKPVSTDIILEKVNSSVQRTERGDFYPRLINDDERNSLLNL